MTEILLAPLLTEGDPAARSEGTLDPLGLYAIGDSLATKLAPGVRERQTHPRFLTAIAVSASVCSDFEEDTVARDGVSEPWQVFEWYMVEGLVRTCRDEEEIRGLSGRLKARDALRDGLHLSRSRYLSVPNVFGFHGVYRLLVRALDIVDRTNRLGETGYNLLTTWAAEQGIEGFVGSDGGRGAVYRRQIVDAVRDGLEAGAVARSGGWGGWEFFIKHLAPYKIGRRERKVIRDALIDPGSSFRRQIIRFLCSDNGREVWQGTESEKQFHEALVFRASPDLRDLLEAIFAYETFSRVVQDAFDDCLFAMTRARGKVSPAELGKIPGVEEAARRIPMMFSKVSDSLDLFGESLRFEESFSSLAEKVGAGAWVVQLLEYHRRVQRKKPPNGKNPWFERFDDGGVIIRPAYRSESGGLHDGSYVHSYRTEPLWSFVCDLKMVRPQ